MLSLSLSLTFCGVPPVFCFPWQIIKKPSLSHSLTHSPRHLSISICYFLFLSVCVMYNSFCHCFLFLHHTLYICLNFFYLLLSLALFLSLPPPLFLSLSFGLVYSSQGDDKYLLLKHVKKLVQ